jgi:hypothetical protein
LHGGQDDVGVIYNLTILLLFNKSRYANQTSMIFINVLRLYNFSDIHAICTNLEIFKILLSQYRFHQTVDHCSHNLYKMFNFERSVGGTGDAAPPGTLRSRTSSGVPRVGNPCHEAHRYNIQYNIPNKTSHIRKHARPPSIQMQRIVHHGQASTIDTPPPRAKLT